MNIDIILEAEGGDTEALQAVINAGQWGLEGSFGRAMMGAIEAGACMLGKHRARDYWGNPIPSRDDVQAGTKGSFDYVANINGVEYAQRLAAL